MQKVLRRTVLAKRQATRRTAKNKGKNESDARKLREAEQSQLNKSIRVDVIAARQARREDLLLGSLAPRRDVGNAKDTYGTLNSQRMRAVEKPEGRIKNWGIIEGDRVVIVEPGHRERGRIGTVKDVQRKTEEVVVEGMNKVDVSVPQYLLVKETNKTPIRSFEKPLPLSSVRLVAALPHHETGMVRDVVIEELHLRKIGLAELRGEEEPSRFVAGLEPPTRIPYPEETPQEWEDNEDDTLRIEVEEKTWVPTLLTPPMPPSIIDELRNKYGKFRDRHDPAYIAEKLQEDEETRERLNSSTRMMTPLKELHKKERAEKKARGKPQLSSKMLERIGEVMAKNQPAGAMVEKVVD